MKRLIVYFFFFPIIIFTSCKKESIPVSGSVIFYTDDGTVTIEIYPGSLWNATGIVKPLTQATISYPSQNSFTFSNLVPGSYIYLENSSTPILFQIIAGQQTTITLY